MTIDINELNAFIVKAKSATYVGNGEPTTSCRVGSHDLRFTDGKWTYLDSYFGGTDFIGEEVVFWADKPVWAMNYYGRILRDDLITGSQTGQIIKASLSLMYKEGRFLGGFQHSEHQFTYEDTSEGNADHFHGREIIRYEQDIVYELVYHGGLVRD
jgi:hypothetical protein